MKAHNVVKANLVLVALLMSCVGLASAEQKGLTGRTTVWVDPKVLEEPPCNGRIIREDTVLDHRVVGPNQLAFPIVMNGSCQSGLSDVNTGMVVVDCEKINRFLRIDKTCNLVMDSYLHAKKLGYEFKLEIGYMQSIKWLSDEDMEKEPSDGN